jgi:hypothetical protein
MDMACSTNGGEEDCLQFIGEKVRKKRDYTEDAGGCIILRWILERQDGWYLLY